VTEGELKKRIWNLTDEKLSYHEGCELTSFHIEDVEDGLDVIVEEMKADFPFIKRRPIKMKENGIEVDWKAQARWMEQRTILRLEWFEKWLGKKEEAKQ